MEEQKEVKMYFRGGQGILNPVDVDGNEIKEGDILTHCYFRDDYPSFFTKHYPKLSKEEIHKISHEPSVVVKWSNKGFLYGEGIDKPLYMHDFEFKHTKKINPPQQITNK